MNSKSPLAETLELVRMLRPLTEAQRQRIKQQIVTMGTPRLRRRSTPDFMSMNEAAEFLAVDRKTIYKFANAKKIPAKKIGGKWFVSRAGLQKFMGVPVHTNQSNNELNRTDT